MTQKERVLRHIEKFGSITSWEAIQDYGITRLSDCIFRLRKEGHKIGSDNLPFTNRFGEKGYFSKYFLQNDKNI